MEIEPTTITRNQWGNHFSYSSKNVVDASFLELSTVLILRDIGNHKLHDAFDKVTIDLTSGKYSFDADKKDAEWILF